MVYTGNLSHWELSQEGVTLDINWVYTASWRPVKHWWDLDSTEQNMTTGLANPSVDPPAISNVPFEP